MTDSFNGSVPGSTQRYIAASGNGLAPSTPSNRKNNGGTFIGESITDITEQTPMTQGLSLATESTGGSPGDPYGSQVLFQDGTLGNTHDPHGVSGVNPNVALPYRQNPTGWIMPFGGGVIGGNANGNLATLGSDWLGNGQNRNMINRLTTTRLQGAYNGRVINILAKPSGGVLNPGLVSRGTGAGNLENFVMATDGVTSAIDNAASPTRHLPGELTYNFNAVGLPTSGNYRPKDQYEV